MTRLSISVDPELLEESRRLAKVKTKREAIEVALREFVRVHHLKELTELAGSGLVEMSPEDLKVWRESSGKRV
jgi:Arc/MetJ family transcription regulator